MAKCIFWPTPAVGCPIPQFSVQKGARQRPLCALDPHFCRALTGASSAAEFYPTVKAALRHESADSEEDRKGLWCHLLQGQLFHSLKAASHRRISSALQELLHADPRLALASRDSWQRQRMHLIWFCYSRGSIHVASFACLSSLFQI